jgi:hypothetical protein
MAHTPETITTVTDYLKYRYQDRIIECLPEYSTLLQRLEKGEGKVDFSGRSITIPLSYNGMGGTGTLAESDYLPFATPSNIDNATISLFYHYFSIAVTGQSMAVSKDNAGAMAQTWAHAIASRTRGFRQHINRQLIGDGNGILCQADGNASGQTITVDNAGGWSGFNNSDVNGDRFITPNMYIQFRNSSGTAHDGGLLVTSIAKGVFPSTSAILTVTGTCSSVVDGDYCYVSTGTTSVDNYGHEMSGIKLLIDDGTVAAAVQGVTSATYPEWRSYVAYGSTPGTAEALTTNRLMNMYNDVTVYGGGMTDFLIGSPATWLTYGNLAADGNTIVNAKKYDTGWPTLSFMGMEFTQDPYMPDEIYFIDKRALKLYECGVNGWIEDDGVIIKQIRGSTAQDAYEAYWKWYLSLGIENRAWCGKMVDISVTGNKF